MFIVSLSRGRRERRGRGAGGALRLRRTRREPEPQPGAAARGRRRRRGAGAAPGAPARRGSVVVMTRLERDRRRAAKRLEVGDHAEDLLIGEADRRLVDDGHARIESRHDEVLGFVHRLGEVLDIAQARDAGLRADIDPLEVGEPERPRLADRVAGEAESLAVHDLAADLDHVGRGQVGSDHGLLRRLNFLLRHHLADIGIERGRREDENADPDSVRDRHDVRLRSPELPLADSGETSPEPWRRRALVCRSKSGRSCRLVIQNTKPIRRKNSEHGHRDDLRREAEGGRERVGRGVPNDAVDMPMLAEPGANVAHESHEPGEGDRDEDQHVLGDRRASFPTVPRPSSSPRGRGRRRWP